VVAQPVVLVLALGAERRLDHVRLLVRVGRRGRGLGVGEAAHEEKTGDQDVGVHGWGSARRIAIGSFTARGGNALAPFLSHSEWEGWGGVLLCASKREHPSRPPPCAARKGEEAGFTSSAGSTGRCKPVRSCAPPARCWPNRR